MSCYIRATVSVLLIIEPWTICKLSTSSPVRFSVKRLLACWKKRFIVFKLLLLLCDSLQFFWVLFYNYHVSVTSHSLGTQHFPQYVSCSKDGRQLCTSTMSGIIIIIVRFSPVLLGPVLQLSCLSYFPQLRDTALSSIRELFQGWPTTV